MARHNMVQLYGKVAQQPKVISKTYNDGSKKEVGRFALTVMRRFSKNGGSKTRRVDNPVIETTDAKFVEQIKSLNENDIVEVKGVVRTKPVRKGCQCKSCLQITVKNGVKTFIHPLIIKVGKHCSTEEEALLDIEENVVISNTVYLIGYLCNDPVMYRDPNRKDLVVTQYEIAVDRKIRLQDDNADSKSDYIWVKSYGKEAIEDFRFLHKGSCVALDGYIQTRAYKKNRTCEFCGESVEVSDSSLEIVPISSEYCNNFRTIEEADKFYKENDKPEEGHDEYDAYGVYQANNFEKLVKQGGDEE